MFPLFSSSFLVTGSALDVAVTVNQVKAINACPSSTISTGGPIASIFPGAEPTSVTTPDGQCGYIYSSYQTPTLSSSPTPVVAASPSVYPPVYGGQSISVTGLLPVYPPVYGSAAYSASFGPSLANSFSGSIVDVTSGAAGSGVNTVTVGLPPLPSGNWPLHLTSNSQYHSSPSPPPCLHLSFDPVRLPTLTKIH